jgi:hypothetical protein
VVDVVELFDDRTVVESDDKAALMMAYRHARLPNDVGRCVELATCASDWTAVNVYDAVDKCSRVYISDTVSVGTIVGSAEGA